MVRDADFFALFAEKHQRTMRTSSLVTILVCPLLLAAGCLTDKTALVPIRSRAECHNRNLHDRDSIPAQERVIVDTALLFSAVRFEESYNYHRDSAYGAGRYEILLYRDFEQALSIPSSAECASPDPDTHHILGGHLYTEAVTRERTFIGRDGQTLFSFEGREILRGLLTDGDDVYTLSESRSGDGFSFRKNGEILFSRESGYVFGDMAEPSYGPSGALYRDMGKICFCYAARLSGKEQYYTVMDGVAGVTRFEERCSVQDVKISGGHPVSAEASYLWFDVENGRVWRDADGQVPVSGHMSYGGGTPIATVANEDDPDSLSEICEGYAEIYHGAKRNFAVLESPPGSTMVYCSDSADALFSFTDRILLSPACAFLDEGGYFCAALSSRTDDNHSILYGDRLKEIALHGFISCIRAEFSISRPS